MITRINYVLFLATVLLLFSCENELDLSAEYDETIVVYGLLDHTQDTQFVKINKSFLGDGNALDYAQEPDSFIYENIYASLTNLNDQSVIVLQPYSAPKQPGVFANEENTVYIADQQIDGGTRYRLDVVNNNSGKAAKAFANVIDTVPLTGYLGINNSQINLFSASGYIPLVISFAVKPQVYRYECKLIFHFLEYPVLNPADISPKAIEFDLGVRLASEASSGSVHYHFNGLDFYKKIAKELEPDTAIEREIVDVEILIRAASKELQLYMDMNGELDGIAQVRPEFSNIENGYGLFSSKYENRVRKFLSINSAQELKEGTYTSKHGFVDNK